MRVFVLANSREQFADWCRSNGVNPVAVNCVIDPRDLRGAIKTGDQIFDARAITPPAHVCQPFRAMLATTNS